MDSLGFPHSLGELDIEHLVIILAFLALLANLRLRRNGRGGDK